MTRLARAALWTVLAVSVAAVPVALALLVHEMLRADSTPG